MVVSSIKKKWRFKDMETEVQNIDENSFTRLNFPYNIKTFDIDFL